MVLPPSLSASLSLIHNASASLVLMLALVLVLVYVLLKKMRMKPTDRQIKQFTVLYLFVLKTSVDVRFFHVFILTW